MSATKRRRLLLAAFVVGLVLLNIWRWWPANPAAGASARGAAGSNAAGSTARLEDFEIRALPADVPERMQRDLFRPKAAAVAVKPAIKELPKVVQEIPVKTPEEIQLEAAKTEFAQIRCMGFSLRGGKAQAYLVNGAENFLVSEGDKAGSRFIVDKITSDAVTLRDPGTGVGGQIAVSGK